MEDFLNLLKQLSTDESTTPTRTSRDSFSDSTQQENSWEREGSSGYASATSSLNSSRRSSEAPSRPRSAAGRSNELDESSSGGGWLAVGAIGAAIGIGAYLVTKAMTADNSVLLTSHTQCSESLEKIKADLQEYPVVGLDCQWVVFGKGQSRSRIALLQLATHKGNVSLIQLHKLSSIPQDLRNILRNPNIIKSGIENIKDGMYLMADYRIEVKGTFDLRHLAEQTGYEPLGLSSLSKDVLNEDIGRDLELIASDWEQEPLNIDQVKYAEAAAKASIDIFVKLIKTVVNPTKQNILNYCRPMIDRRYVYKSQDWKY